MGKIIEIPFSGNLVEFVADKLLEGERKSDFSSTGVVFAHQRPAFYLRRMLAEKLSQPFFPPRIFSMDEFMTFLASRLAPGLARINNLDSAYLLFRVVRQIPDNPWQAKLSFREFLSWGLKLGQVIEELDIELIEEEKLKSLELVENWEPEVTQKAGHLMQHLTQIRHLFHSLLKEGNLTTRGRDYARAVESLKEDYPIPFSTIYLAGLFALTRAERAVVRHFLKEPQVLLVRQNDGTPWTPFQEMDRWAEKEEAEGAPAFSPEIFLHSAFNTHSQILGLKDVLLNNGAGKPASTRLPVRVHTQISKGGPGRPTEPEKTAIVLPEPEPLIPLLSEVMTALPVDYNITMGYPAVRTPVYALLSLFINLEEKRVGDAYYVPDYLALLMHPYIKNIRRTLEPIHMRILIHSLEEVLLSGGKTFITLSEIEGVSEIFDRAAQVAGREIPLQNFKEALTVIHETFIRRTSGIKTLARLGGHFEEILTFLLRHSPAAHYPFSGEFFQSFFLLLDKIKSCLLKDEEFEEPRDLFDLFCRVAEGERISFPGIPLKGLQILGLLETRGLNFDCVFLLDANEGVLPSVEFFDSLLPLPVRAALGLPLHYQKEEIYDYHFHHLIFSSRRAHIFYRQTEKDFRSRFVEKLVWEREKRAGQRGVLPAEPVELNVSLRPSCGFEVPKGPEVLRVLREMSFSLIELNSYLLCPLQFYFASVLKLKEKERMRDRGDSARVGIVLHKILERLYRPLAGKGIMGEGEYAYLEKSLPRVLDEVFAETFGESRGESYLLREMALQRLKKYILKEKQQLVNGLSIISVEEPFSYFLKLEDGREVQLTGRADRIDRYEPGGEYMIVDYKSGRDLSRHSFKAFGEVLFSREEMREKIKSLQLPFYAFLYQRTRSLPPESMNSRLISLRTGREKILFDGEIDRRKVLEDVFLPTLGNLIGEILNPDIPFRYDDRNEATCQYCSFSTFCHKTL